MNLQFYTQAGLSPNGVGRMVDADLGLESALIQALQVKQELSAQSVSIVNNAPQTLLALFRN